MNDVFTEKPHRSTFKTTPGKLRSTEPGTFVHMDLCGPLATISFGGASYCMLVKDDARGYMCIYFLAHKYEALTKFQSVEKEILRDMKVQVNRIRTVLEIMEASSRVKIFNNTRQGEGSSTKSQHHMHLNRIVT